VSALLAGAWALAVFALFLHGHPFRAFAPYMYGPGFFSWGGFFSTWAGRVVPLAALGAWLFFLSGWGRPAGRWILGAGGGRRLSAVAGSRMGIGYGLLAMAVFALGMSGLLFPSVLLAVSAAPVIAFKGWAYFRRPVLSVARESRPWLLLALLPVVFAVPLLLTPEGSWDAMVYHLRFPSFFLMEHKRFLVADSPFTGYPDLAEMHYVLALGLGGSDQVAKFMHAACWLLSGAAIFSVVRPFGRVAGWASLLVWLGSAMGMQLAGLSYVDHSVAWMGALAAAFISPASRGALLAGVFAGWCAATKYTGGFAVIGVLAALARPRSLRPLLPATAGMLLAGGAWPLANLLELGSPLYPFLTGIFGGISSPAVDFWRTSPLGDAPAPGGWLANTWLRIAHDDGGVGTSFSPLWLAVIIPALLAGPRDPLRLRYFCAALAAWAVLPLSSRFLLPFIPAGLMAAAPAWGERRLALVLAVSALSFLPVALFDKLRASALQFNALVTGGGFMTRADYLQQGLQPKPEYWDAAVELNRSTPAKSRLLLVSGIKSYYIERRAMVPHQHLDPVPLYRFARAASSAERMAVRLRQLGITHVVYFERALEGGVAKRPAWMDEAAMSRYVGWWRGWTRYDFRKGDCFVYRVSRVRADRMLGRIPMMEQDVMSGLANNDLAGAGSASALLARLAPDSSAALMARGLVELVGREGGYYTAERLLTKSVENPEASSIAWRALGYAWTKLNNQEKAGECFLAAIAFNPSDAEAHFNLGLIYNRMGRMDAGLRELNLAAAIDPTRPDFRQALAQARAGMRVP
jgi:tetratricopeptide (TPR) repeat protein